MKRFILLSILTLFSLSAFGQQIDDVTFYQQDSLVIVNYKIKMNRAFMKNVRLIMGYNDQERELREVSGDVGNVFGNGLKKIEWRVFDETKGKEINGDIYFKVEADTPREKSDYTGTFWMEYVYSPSAPYGFSIGYCNRFGAYLRGKFGKGVMDEDVLDSRLSITGGFMARLHRCVYLYAGLGYGRDRSKPKEHSDYDDDDDYGNGYGYGYGYDYDYYAKNRYGIASVELEAGLMVRLYRSIIVSAGVNSIPKTKLIDFNVGLGFIF